jgi:ADP-dependent NAD(P)H-hydrate dehydratase / NAD(P)H-hydrate epimerase
MKILTVAQMRETERAADAAGVSYRQMMQNAGQEAAAIILQRLAGWQLSQLIMAERTPRVLVLAGPGNNGGDGLVCARALLDTAQQPDGPALTVQVYLLKPRADDDPVFAPLREHGILIANAGDDLRLRVLHQMVTHADVIVDALLGTGVSRPIDGTLREILDEVRAVLQGEARPVVVALDGVTGMNYDTGALDLAAIQADLTVTFHAPKRGHYCYPAARANGELVVTPIGIEHLTLTGTGQADGDVRLTDDPFMRAHLPRRAPDANKGSYGKVLVIGGCIDYSGAPALAAEAAYRVGTGLVTMAVPRNIQSTASILCREATFLTLHGTTDSLSTVALGRLEQAAQELDHRHAIIIGPGMGQDPAIKPFLVGLLDIVQRKEGGAHVVLDADALNHLSALPDWPALLPPHSILTPHPGEMARLTGLSVKDVQANRIGLALESAKSWGHIVVLKGAFSIAAFPDNRALVLPYSNSALAVAGTGDVLTGCIAGMLAQGLTSEDAAICGAYLHARAGERWREQHGEAGLLASDLLPLLPKVLSILRS